jgi:hypothetical protein
VRGKVTWLSVAYCDSRCRCAGNCSLWQQMGASSCSLVAAGLEFDLEPGFDWLKPSLGFWNWCGTAAVVLLGFPSQGGAYSNSADWRWASYQQPMRRDLCHVLINSGNVRQVPGAVHGFQRWLRVTHLSSAANRTHSQSFLIKQAQLASPRNVVAMSSVVAFPK